VEVGFGEKSSPLAGHPAICMIGLQLPVSSGQQEKVEYIAHYFPAITVPRIVRLASLWELYPLQMDMPIMLVISLS
jgi:hypothetical protein